MNGAPAGGAVTLHQSTSALARLAAAHRFVDSLPPASEALVVGASRDAVDDFVRENAVRRGATFGLHRFSLRGLAWLLVRPDARGLAPATGLVAEAVATRAAFEERESLDYLAPIAGSRSFGRTLASTLEEVRLGGVEPEDLSACDRVGGDLEALSQEYARQLGAADLVDLPELYRMATAVVAAGEPAAAPLDVPVVLLDVPVHDRAVLSFVAALAGRSTRLLATVPQGDARTWGALCELPGAERLEPPRVELAGPSDDPRSTDTLPIRSSSERGTGAPGHGRTGAGHRASPSIRGAPPSTAEPGPPADSSGADTPLERVRNRLFEPIAARGREGAGSAGAAVPSGAAPGGVSEEDPGPRAALSATRGAREEGAARVGDDARARDDAPPGCAPGGAREEDAARGDDDVALRSASGGARTGDAVRTGDDASLGFAPGESREGDAGREVALSQVPGEDSNASRDAEDAGRADGVVSLFSAPGEARECVEIARQVHEEAAAGVPFDRMAVVLRAPQVYGPLLETALRRAGVEAWFVRGTRAPDPAGRAFLALLACAAEQLSARRFSEYLSLGQVPEPDAEGAPPAERARWVMPAEADETLPASALPVQGSLFDVADLDPDRDGTDPNSPPDADDRPVVDGTLRAPWRWDRLLVESAVIGGRDRWVRRLDGLERELRLQKEECADDDPESPRARRLERDIVNLGHLRRFALPVIERLDALPGEAPWGGWLHRLEALAPMVLRRPDRVLATLGEMRPMAGVGPVSLSEVRDVLAERLTELPVDPPARRYGRVFVGGPEHVRGRVFDVVFVPGLAERMFPQRPRQDPILLDDDRRRLNAAATPSAAPGDPRLPAPPSTRPTLPAERPVARGVVHSDREARPSSGTEASGDRGGVAGRQDAREAASLPEGEPVPLGLPLLDDRADQERLLLRLAVGAAARRLRLSYSRLQSPESRPRVPSFYALDLERARTGRVPDFAITEREAFARVQSRLAWPAPPDPDRAIDDIEHDLAVLEPLLHQDASEPRGRARYLLDLEPALSRSLRTRWARWTHRAWSRFDGVHQLEGGARAALDAHRLTARPYSVTALQRFAVCPYQFLLAAVHRLQPREEIAPLERLDPLTRGRMFHEAQAETVRGLEERHLLPVTPEGLAEAWDLLDTTLDGIAARYREDLAPAIDRVWTDEIEKLRIDLKGWLQQVADEDGEWKPIRAELGFGFAPGPGRDHRSLSEPVRLDGGWMLHGVVDLVEARARPTAAGELRVTDHKTGKNRPARRMVVGRGEVLQPVLYGLAVEQALGRPVAASRLYFATLAGGYSTQSVPLDDTARHHGREVLSIIDRAIEEGVILPAPRPGACQWCDYRVVCGPWEEIRAKRKGDTKLVDLQALRRLE